MFTFNNLHFKGQYVAIFLTSSFPPLPFHFLQQDDEAKKVSKDIRKKGESDAKQTTSKEGGEEEEETKMEDEPEQSEHQAEIQEEPEGHTEGEEALSADIVRANILSWYYVFVIV